MDKKTLTQYRALQREIPQLKKDIEKLYEKLEKVPVVKGKVTKSSDDFPYIEEHISVEMEEPKEASELRKRIGIKELRLENAEKDKTHIEQFIAGIEDSTNRQIFELCFMKGKKQAIVADMVGLERSSISKRIKACLRLSHNSQK